MMEIQRIKPKPEEFIIVLNTLEAKNLILDLESESKSFRNTTKKFIEKLKGILNEQNF